MGKAFGYSAVVVFALFGAGVLWLSMPIFFYPLVTPMLSDVLRRPAVVPAKGARADYHWKGSGVGWTWCDDVGGGSVHWDAYRGQVKASLALKPMCHRFDGSRYSNPWDVSFRTGDDEVLFNSVGQDPWQYCRTAVPHEKIEAYLRLAQAAMRGSNSEQTAVLSEFQRRLRATHIVAAYVSTNGIDECRYLEQGAGPDRG